MHEYACVGGGGGRRRRRGLYVYEKVSEESIEVDKEGAKEGRKKKSVWGKLSNKKHTGY